MSAPPRLTLSGLASDRIAHGFFSRVGGVSTGDYLSLNTGPGSGDKPADVAENRRRCAAALNVAPERLVTLHQKHSAIVEIVDAPWRAGPPEADALVTNTPGIAVGALAADCMPWLFADPEARIVAAAHAGWRGALAGILENTIDAMVSLGARAPSIRAGLGPCLRQPNFEVGMDLVDAFADAHPESMPFFSAGAREDKRQFDLAGFGAARLRAKGVHQIGDVEICTLASQDDYFSYRASRAAGRADYGRNLSAIALL
ncbi:MAG: peptidoglycan editing factor PgeF [Pseudomonadota bacterium]